MPAFPSLKLFITYAREDHLPALLKLKAHLRRKAIRILVSLLVILNFPNLSSACMCIPPETVALNIALSDAVFVGVLTQRVRADSLYKVWHGSAEPAYYFNLKIICYHKGLSEVSDFISVFDDDLCGGFLKHVNIGDTILGFADFIGGNFLLGSQCKRYSILSKMPERKGMDSVINDILRPATDEILFLQDSTKWRRPEAPPRKKFDNHKLQKEGNRNSCLDSFLAISLILNLILLIYTFRKRKK